MKMEISSVAKVLGGKRVLRRNIQNRMDLVELSRQGLTKAALINLADYLSCTIGDMAQIVSVTERTLLKHTASKPFNRFVSEQILQIAEVAARGAEVFEDRSKFLAWMNHPNRALANKTPMSLLNSKYGVDMILDELGRIEHGVFS
ncbi:DUF2384 domain-containing protein [candidate division KSB1 bacterium]|nr:DUF2384 domain-containing protein [candidate division KSB1 bacterium]